jgi:hypothetical protein
MSSANSVCNSIRVSAIAVFAMLLWILGAAPALESPRHGSFVQSFDGPLPPLPLRSSHINYDLDPARENFFISVPANYDSRHDFGLIVFIPPDNKFTDLPRGWEGVLADHNLLFIAPQRAGNDQPVDRRYGLAVLAEGEMLTHYRIDPSRVFAAGFSGGARIANDMGFYQSDVFRGTIQICGANFYRHVRQTNPPAPDAPEGEYGLLSASPQEVDNARSNVRFALITGTRDFRHGNILDLYENGYVDDGFAAHLFDVSGMLHTLCDADTLSRAITFVEPARAVVTSARPPLSAPTSRPLRPAAASRPAATDEEKRATRELEMARNYLADNRPDLARPRLNKVIQTYPNTPSAKAAQALLDKLEGQ